MTGETAEAAVAAATRIVHGSITHEDAKAVAGMFLHTIAAVAKLEGILESVGLSHSQAVQIIKLMNA